MKKYIAFCLILALLLSLAGCSSSDDVPALDYDGLTVPEDFSFAITWGCYGISSYDSKTGTLIKTNHATHPEDYITHYELSDEYREKIYRYITEMSPGTYPDEYDPHYGKVHVIPSETLILTVRFGDVEKTIVARGVDSLREAEYKQGQDFLTAFRSIIDILTESEEWKALPDYEFRYC